MDASFFGERGAAARRRPPGRRAAAPRSPKNDASMTGEIEVYRDWTAGMPAQRLGGLRTRPGRADELFDFTFDEAALADETIARVTLDPDLGSVSYTHLTLPT